MRRTEKLRRTLRLERLEAREVPAGDGLAATYFDNIDFTGASLARTDPVVNFNWDRGSPAASVAADTFSARWTGRIVPRFSEPHTFHVTGDDGVRLWVNGQQVIDAWSDHAAKTFSGSVALEAGKPADLKLEYYERGGRAVAKLEWQSARQTREVVPQSQLFSTAAPPPTSPAAGLTPLASSYLGGTADDDGVRGSAILSDGTVVLASRLGDANPGGATARLLNGATAVSRGAVVRLSADGKTVLSVTRLADNVSDLSADAADNLYVATGTGGLLKLNPSATAVLWHKTGRADRTDAAPNGDVAALGGSGFNADGTGFTGAGTVHVFDAAGGQLGSFATLGGRGTYDVAIDAATRSVFTTGYRQANGPSGNPVQISYLRSQAYDGAQKWKAYDWTAAQVDDPRSGGTGPTNNMADTRGLRLDVGADGRLYVAYQAAGGNHIFRYDPFDIRKPAAIVGGDKYHEFYNTRSENKTVFARHDAATGAVLASQQLVNRLPDGRGNTIGMFRGGDIQADSAGRVYLTGAAAYGTPLTFDPLAAGSYTGGAFLAVMSPDFRQRLLVTRPATGGQGMAVAARQFAGEADARVVFGGATGGDLWSDDAVQPAFGGGKQDGFFTVFGGGRELARAATASASSSQAGYGPAAATDGNPATFWRSAAAAGPQWLQADLGTRRTVGRVVIGWGTNYASRYRVQLSDDGTAWRDLAVSDRGSGGSTTVLAGGVSRYVRVSVEARRDATLGAEVTALSVWGE